MVRRRWTLTIISIVSVTIFLIMSFVNETPSTNLAFENTVDLNDLTNPRIVLDSECTGFEIPVAVVARNNPTLLRQLIMQLRECFNAQIFILDDSSDFPPMITYLKSLQKDNRITVIKSNVPGGPHSWFRDPPHPILLNLPRFFAYTDSDLRLNSDLPRNFLCVLAHITQRLQIPKAGLALDLTDKDRMWPFKDFYGSHSIWSWEDNFWARALRVPGWPGLDVDRVFDAAVDTTFAVYDKGLLNCSDRKEYPSNMCFTARQSVRVSGVFTAKHRPWYPEVLARIPEDEITAMFANNMGSVANLMRRKGFFGNTTAKAEAKAFLSEWEAMRLNFEKTEDIMSFKCSLEGRNGFSGVGVPGKTILSTPKLDSMKFPL